MSLKLKWFLTFGLAAATCFLFLMRSTPTQRNLASEAPLSNQTINELKALRSQIRSWAPMCEDGSLTFHMCPFGDALEYMGMLCLSGDEHYCDQVKRSQDADGRFWRSPGLVNQPLGDDGPTFSRDMARGAWAYIVAKKDKESALKWMEYVRNNDYKLCSKSGSGFDACNTAATYWTFATQVFDWLELPRDRKMKNYKFLIEKFYSPIEAKFQPKGYQMLLTGEMIYTLYEMEKRGARLKNRETLEQIADIIHTREPKNPFYRYLAKGVDEKGAKILLETCPRTKPNVPIVNGWPIYAIDYGDPMEKQLYKQGGGHYCIFLINLFTQSVD